MSDAESDTPSSKTANISRKIGKWFDPFRRWEKKWRGLATVVAVVAGGSFALVQFFSAKHVEKINRTMEYIQRYEDGNVASARRSINDAIRPMEKDIQNLPEKPDPMVYFAGLDDLIRQGKIQESQIDIVVDFYEGLSVCVRNQICDQTVAMAYFGGDESVNFGRSFKKYIGDRRINNHCYAEGLLWFAAKTHVEAPCKQELADGT
jgi:hypothetical protein